MTIVPMPSPYVEWRESQGFNLEESALLYWKKDSVNVDEIKIFLESQLTSNQDTLFDLNFGVECINKAFKQIYDRGNKDLLEFLIMIFSTKNDFINATEYALIGHYQTSMVLLRSCFEGQLRMIFNSIKAKEEKFTEILSEKKWPTNISNRRVHWEDSLNLDKPLSLFDMCVILDKIKMTSPLKNSYEYLGIKELNSYTHRNIDKIIDSESFLVNAVKGNKFDKEKLRVIFDYYQNYAEFALIIMQNAADIIQPEFQPILYPDSEVKSKFPNYRKLTIDRLYNLN